MASYDTHVALKDGNSVASAIFEDSSTPGSILRGQIDEITGRILVDSTGGGGGGVGIITVTGTINDSNVSFTAGSQPTVLDINGAVYSPTGGAITWTYSSGSITLSSPVGTGGSIFGIGGTSSGGNTFVYNEVVSGSGTSWTLANTPVIGLQAIYANGQKLTPTVDYSITSAAITTVDSWAAGTILADYQH